MFDLFENFPFLLIMIFAILFRVLSARAKQRRRNQQPPLRRPLGPPRPPEKAGDYDDEDEEEEEGFPKSPFHGIPGAGERGSALPPLEKTVIMARETPAARPVPVSAPLFVPERPRIPEPVPSPLVLPAFAAGIPSSIAPAHGDPAGERGRPGESFPGSIDYLPPLKRAIALSEIFCPPKGLNP
jgi:hypothetical protein